jgi:hypothetical protein
MAIAIFSLFRLFLPLCTRHVVPMMLWASNDQTGWYYSGKNRQDASYLVLHIPTSFIMLVAVGETSFLNWL